MKHMIANKTLCSTSLSCEIPNGRHEITEIEIRLFHETICILTYMNTIRHTLFLFDTIIVIKMLC